MILSVNDLGEGRDARIRASSAHFQGLFPSHERDMIFLPGAILSPKEIRKGGIIPRPRMLLFPKQAWAGF